MDVAEQYKRIEPDTITKFLSERGWESHGAVDYRGSFDADMWVKGSLFTLIEDGDQREALGAVFDYEGPEAVAEI